MSSSRADLAFLHYRTCGDPGALEEVFDLTAPVLLRLARPLATPEATAEDLVQETFLTAMVAAHTYRPPQPVLPWLAGILGNHARVARRRGGRAIDPRRLAPEGRLDPVLEADARELGARLEREIERLPEVYRPVLRLTLQHGLEPQEIGRALGRRSGTVRVQLLRALRILRAALPIAAALSLEGTAEARRLARVRRTVVARARLGRPRSLRKLPRTRAGTAALVAIALVLATGLGLRAAERARAPSRAPRAATPAGLLAADRVRAAEGPVERSATRAPVAPSAAQPSVTTASPSLVVTVRHGDPPRAAAGCAVRLMPRDRYLDAGTSLPRASTDAEGHARFDGIPAGRWQVDVGWAGSLYTLSFPEQREASVDLPRGIQVCGQVVDEDEQPVAGATVWAYGLAVEPECVGRSDAEGRFALADARSGWGLVARASDRAPSAPGLVHGTPGTQLQARLRLGTRTTPTRGRVRDARGHPVAGARVVAMTMPQRPDGLEELMPTTLTDADGAFALGALTPGPHVLLAYPDGSEGAFTSLEFEAPTDALELWLHPPATILGRIAAPAATRAGSLVVAHRVGGVALPARLPEKLARFQAPLAADGSFRLDGLAQGTYRLGVAEPETNRWLATRELLLAEGEQETWNVRLSSEEIRLQPLTGERPRALDPLEPWLVLLHRGDGRGPREPLQSVLWNGTRELGLPTSGAGPFDVTLLAPLRGLPQSRIRVAAAKGLRSGEVVRLSVPDESEGARVRGTALDAFGAPRRGCLLEVREREQFPASTVLTATDPDGNFEIAGLSPGHWRLSEGTGRAFQGGRELWLHPGEDLDLGEVCLCTEREEGTR